MVEIIKYTIFCIFYPIFTVTHVLQEELRYDQEETYSGLTMVHVSGVHRKSCSPPCLGTWKVTPPLRLEVICLSMSVHNLQDDLKPYIIFHLFTF